MKGKRALTLIFASCIVSAQPWGQEIPSNPVSVRDGVYSDEQRSGGKAIFLKGCSGCHGETLRGGTAAPPLVGPDFVSHWKGRGLDELVEKIRQMPPNDPGKWSDDQCVELLAVILAANRFPAGRALETNPARLHQLEFLDPGASP